MNITKHCIAYRLCLGASVASAVLLGGLLWATDTGLQVGSFVPVATIVLPLALVHAVYTVWRPDPAISAATGGVALVIGAGVTCGTSALAALRVRADFIDTNLAAADAALGIPMVDLLVWTADAPQIATLLKLVYVNTVPAIFFAVLVLAFSGRSARVWELCWSFVACLIVCTLASAWFPALGPFTHFAVPADVLERLPDGSGVFHMPTVEAFRSGAVATIKFSQIEGVVTFPSFHACMALMTAYAFRGTRWSGPAWGWGILTLVSTVPIGGHYVIDIVAGALVWLGAVAVCRPGLLRLRAAPAVRPTTVALAGNAAPREP